MGHFLLDPAGLSVFHCLQMADDDSARQTPQIPKKSPLSGWETSRLEASASNAVTTTSLLEGLRNGTELAWQRLMRRQRRAILAEAERRGCTPAQAEDVAQIVVIELMQRIKDFRRRGNTGEFRKYIRKLTAWRARDLIRTESRDEPVEGVAELADVESAQDTSTTAAFSEVVEICLNRLHETGRISSRDQQIFRLLVLDGLRPVQVGKLLRVNVPLLYLAKFRTLAKLRAELQLYADEWK